MIIIKNITSVEQKSIRLAIFYLFMLISDETGACGKDGN